MNEGEVNVKAFLLRRLRVGGGAFFVVAIGAASAAWADVDAEVVKWWRQEAELGHAPAQYNLGVMYARGDGVEKDAAEAVSWYRRAAEQGLARAQLNLGLMYAKGDGVAEDDSEAARWLRKAAERGSAAAQYRLGVMYERGEGVAQDFVLAHLWLDLARAQGNATARRSMKPLVAKMTAEQMAEAEQMAQEWEPSRQ